MELTRGRTIGLAAAAAAVALVVWLFLRDPWAEFDETVAALEAEGFATTPEAFAGEIPPDTNGAIDLLAALEWVDSNLGAESTWSARGPWTPMLRGGWSGPADPDEAAALAAFLKRVRPFFDRVDVALAKERFAFPVVRSPDGSVAPDGMLAMERSERLLIASARGATEERERIRSAVRLLALAARVEPARAGDLMVAASIGRRGAGAVRRLLAAGCAQPTELRAAVEPWLRAPAAAGARRALRGECVHAADAVRLYRAGRPKAGTRVASASERLREIVRHPFGTDRAGLTPGRGPFDLAAVSAAARAATDDAATIADELRRHRSESGSNSAELLARVFGDFAQLGVQRDLGRFALAAAEFREREGRAPASFGELAPLFPDGPPAATGDDRRFALSEHDGVLELWDRQTRLPGPGDPPAWILPVR